MKFQVLSVQAITFKGDDGKERSMWRVYCADASGAVGSVYSSKPISAGDVITLVPSVNKDGRFTCRIGDNK